MLGLDFLAIADAGNARAHIDDARRNTSRREMRNTHADRRNAAYNQQKPSKARSLGLAKEGKDEADEHDARRNRSKHQ